MSAPPTDLEEHIVELLIVCGDKFNRERFQNNPVSENDQVILHQLRSFLTTNISEPVSLFACFVHFIHLNCIFILIG